MPLNQSKEMKDTRLHLGKQASEIERKLKEKYTFTDVDIRTEHHEPDELIIENETIHSFCFILTAIFGANYKIYWNTISINW